MFVPIIRWKLFCIFLAVTMALGFIIYLVDIIGTYLKSFLDDNKFPVYMKLLLKIHELQQIW